LWAGACLLLALAGCGGKSDPVKGEGSYSPIITGISSNFEPAARGAENLLTAQVTNVNGLALTYTWSVPPGAGTFTNITGPTATWTPPDSIGTFDVTVTVEAQDGETHYSKTLTVHMAVDNQFIRWTRSDGIKFDPAPTTGGGVLYAEYHNPVTRSSDVYRINSALGAPAQLTSGFFSAFAPSPRADQFDFAFAGKKLSTEAGPSIFLLPFGGGDTASARVFEARSSKQTFLDSPRFPWTGNRLAYVTDSISVFASGGVYTVYWRDAFDLNAGPVLLAPDVPTWLTAPSWGRDADSDGNPDSIMTLAIDFPGSFAEAVNGVYIFESVATPSRPENWRVWLSGVQIEAPDWSPDGQHVVFAMKNAGTNERDIWIINRASADISGAVRVTSGPANDSQPRFSADGNSIFFISNRVDHYGLNGIYGTERRGTDIWSVAQFDKP
jgi:hypothetical protein